MKKGTLPTGWIRWRRRRYQALASQGLASHLAWEVAAGEAKRRHLISGIIGNSAARDAELQCVSNGGKLRFVLIGDTARLTSDQRTALEELNCRDKEAA